MQNGGMTREEAIKMLKSKLDGKTDTSYEWVEAVGMAIKALKDEKPLVTCHECKYFTSDYAVGVKGLPIPLLAGPACTKWGEGCRTYEDGWCYLAERAEDDYAVGNDEGG